LVVREAGSKTPRNKETCTTEKQVDQGEEKWPQLRHVERAPTGKDGSAKIKNPYQKKGISLKNEREY